MAKYEDKVIKNVQEKLVEVLSVILAKIVKWYCDPTKFPTCLVSSLIKHSVGCWILSYNPKRWNTTNSWWFDNIIWDIKEDYFMLNNDKLIFYCHTVILNLNSDNYFDWIRFKYSNLCLKIVADSMKNVIILKIRLTKI